MIGQKKSGDRPNRRWFRRRGSPTEIERAKRRVEARARGRKRGGGRRLILRAEQQRANLCSLHRRRPFEEIDRHTHASGRERASKQQQQQRQRTAQPPPPPPQLGAQGPGPGGAWKSGVAGRLPRACEEVAAIHRPRPGPAGMDSSWSQKNKIKKGEAKTGPGRTAGGR